MNSTRSLHIYKHVNICEWIKRCCIDRIITCTYIPIHVQRDLGNYGGQSLIDGSVKLVTIGFEAERFVHLYDIKSNVYAIQARGNGQGAHHPQISSSKLTFFLNLHLEYWIFMELPPPLLPTFLGHVKNIEVKEGSRYKQ